MTGPPSQDRY